MPVLKPKNVRITTGLTKGRVDWDKDVNRVLSVLVDTGLHARAIAKRLGFSTEQVYYRARLLGLRFREFRNGNTVRSQNLLDMYDPATLPRNPDAATEVTNALLACAVDWKGSTGRVSRRKKK